MEFRDEVALRFLDKILEEVSGINPDEDTEDTIEYARKVADSIAIYTNEFIKAHNATYHPDVLKKTELHEPYKLPAA